MSVINTNQFATPFGPAAAVPEFENAPSPGFGESAANYAQPSDGIAFGATAPISEPIAFPNPISVGEGGFTGGSSGGWNFSGILNQIGNVLNSLFNELGSYLSGSSTSATSGTPSPTASPETYYADATASSTGDPHLAFNATTGNGATVSDKWDSMQSHANLLSSDSFEGGYRVSTVATPLNSNNVAYNASATVTTDAGATSVTMNANGSYAVTENGQNVTLTQGQATSLGNGESVTLNSDGSLTIDDSNGAGGSIATTLQSKGSYVNVDSSAQNVDLGGYLVHKTDDDVDPVAQAAALGSGSVLQGGTPNGIFPISYGNDPFQYAGGNFSEFDPDAENTSLQSIELG